DPAHQPVAGATIRVAFERARERVTSGVFGGPAYDHNPVGTTDARGRCIVRSPDLEHVVTAVEASHPDYLVGEGLAIQPDPMIDAEIVITLQRGIPVEARFVDA